MSTIPLIVTELSVKIAYLLFYKAKENNNSCVKINNCLQTFEANFLDLLYKDYFSENLVGTVMWQGSTSQNAKEECAQRYVDYFLNYQIEKPKKGIPSPKKFHTKLNKLRIDPIEIKEWEEIKSPISFWEIIEINTNQKTHKKINTFQETLLGNQTENKSSKKIPDDLLIKLELMDVVSTINRHYGNLFSLGLYPPDYLDKINVSQSGKLKKIIENAKQLAPNENEWQLYFHQAWKDALKKPKLKLVKIGHVTYNSYEEFCNNEIIRIIFGKILAHPIEISLDKINVVDESTLDKDTLDKIEETEELEDFSMSEFLLHNWSILVDVCEKEIKEGNIEPSDQEIISRIIHSQSVLDIMDKKENDEEIFNEIKEKLLEIVSKYLDNFIYHTQA